MSVEMDQREGGSGGINITPLVDVCLVLVLIFMITMPLSVLHGIDVKRQALQKYGLTTPQESVFVHLTADGVTIQDVKGKEQPVASQDFGMVLTHVIERSKSKQVFLRADRDVAHGQTVWVLDLAKQNGAGDISLME